ncbi:hypothetical protein [Pseudoalteromonas denitrificans]|uniref:Uncharacterized protein n=1 Tax=Pseudoalteromonas denitrificans DSM 6059 TaxID=1123010 RepID=A0A1I1FYZ6_9GAMM|nr:hypothetical protein [Pseudoalteromonas denitrificans]SFC04505.1 hypothetical protein SAMN02745724_00745 [Pseudoalteromonas denitrificans DSM 6059]
MTDTAHAPLYLLAEQIANAKTRDEKIALAAKCPGPYLAILRKQVRTIYDKRNIVKPAKKTLPACFISLKLRLKRKNRKANGKTKATTDKP